MQIISNKFLHQAFALALLISLAMAPLRASAWGPDIHRTVTRLAADSVPPDMEAWTGYGDLLTNLSMLPDRWRDEDPMEGPRHYIDLELFGIPADLNLPEDYSRVSRAVKQDIQVEFGVAPWVIMELQSLLTRAMKEGDWPGAVRLAAAQSHYVSDTHQPLHCTDNHNGQLSGNHGIHKRWEDRMVRRQWSREPLLASQARYLEKPWKEINRWILAAHGHFEKIMQADDKAKKKSNRDLKSDEYFQALWEETESLLKQQAADAVTMTASLWYTAWINAEQPEIPRPPSHVSMKSVHLDDGFIFEERDRNMSRIVILIIIVVVAFVIDAFRRKKNMIKED